MRIKQGFTKKCLKVTARKRGKALLCVSLKSSRQKIKPRVRISQSVNKEVFDTENLPLLQEANLTITDQSDSSDDNNILSQPNFSDRLAWWAVNENISHASLGKLLEILKSVNSLNELNVLPKDARTLLKTPKTSHITPLGTGVYFYFGITETLQNLIDRYSVKLKTTDVIHLSVNIDGVPLFKSTNESFWPILCLVKTIKLLKTCVFCVALFKGTGKPNANHFLKDFVHETTELGNNGISLCSERLEFKITSLICDLPAKSFVLCIKGHNGYFSCSKCTLEGDFENNVMCFPETNFEKRTDQSFRDRCQPEHHIGDSLIERIPNFNMVDNVPIDYMHCILLGVVKRLLCNRKYGWVFGKPPYKLSATVINLINIKLRGMQRYIPSEFSRKTRSIVESKRYKATEFRLLLIYTGLIVFKNLIKKRFYNNFACLSLATSILISPELSRNEDLIQYAHELFKCFITNSIKLYGPDFISHNVHNLLHLIDSVKIFGPLDQFSAFPFENYMPQIIKKVRKSALPLQQVINRTIENRALNVCTSLVKNNEKFCIEHSTGPLLENCSNPQFKVLRTNKFCINTSKIADRFVQLKDNQILEIFNFATCNQLIVILGKLYKRTQPFFIIPCSSALVDITFIELKSNNLCIFSTSDVKKKVIVLPFENKLVCFPLLHN